jgi:N-acetylglutamate synthase-like GNAT family acetyltransferase
VRIIETTDREILEKIQTTLDEEKSKTDVGIVDIWTVYEARHFVILNVEHLPIAVATVDGEAECPELYKLYVIPKYRKQGLAIKLVEHVIKRLAQQGTNELFVEMTTKSMQFWFKVADKYSYNHYEGTLKLCFQLNA